jgi:hypothetical protein
MAEHGIPKGPKPFVHAVMMCDYTIRDRDTGKTSLIGIFDRVEAPDFPVIHPSLFVYVNMTDVEGEYVVGLELRRAGTMKRLGYGERIVTYSDRLAQAEVIFNLRNVMFEEAGAYEFRVHANGEDIGGRIFTVVQQDG